MQEEFLSIGIDQLMPDPTQPRKAWVAEVIERLAASIKARGVLQPLRVIRDDDRKCYVIVTGESRYRAAMLAGLTALPCLVVDGQPDEAALLADRIVENTCRHDLRPLELARSLAKLKALKGGTSQQLAAELVISGASISRSESLLSLPDDIQALVDAGTVPESSAYELSRLMPDEAAVRELAQAVAAGRLRRDGVAETVRNRVGRRKERPKAGRVASRLADIGVSVTVTAAGRPVTADDVRKAIDQLRRLEKKLSEANTAAV